VLVVPAIALVAVVLAVAGCGGNSPSTAASTQPVVTTEPESPTTVEETATAPKPDEQCEAIGRSDFRYCERLKGPWQVAMTLQVRDGEEWKTLAREPARAFRRHGSGNYWGAWGTVKVSPDGKTLLATWLVECDTAYAFFIPAAGGKPRLVTGELDWDASPMSRGLGWAADGRARVDVITGGCGGGLEWTPGIYLIDPATGNRELVE
jgi:hypothetical protein